MTKLVNKIGTVANNGVMLPFNGESTCGFAFVEYASVEDAKHAVEVLQDYKFDKNHCLTITPYERAMELRESEEQEEFVEQEPAPFEPMPNTSSWLEDGGQRDQFVIRQGRDTVVYWNDGGKNAPNVDYDGSREKEAGVAWCEYYVQWSPHGSYLATLVPSKGVILWGGKTFEKLKRFPHAGVQHVMFSPKENYLLTNNMNHQDPKAIKVFDINNGKLVRTFALYPKGVTPSEKTPPPAFQWSHDDSFLCRMGVDLIAIYETPSMQLLDKRSLLADGICEFQLSPTANIIAYWAPEHGNAPAHVDLLELPSRKKLRQKNLFNVNKCSMVWHPDGDFLGVKVTRHTKSKKTLYNNLELFRIHEPGVPVEMMDVQDAIMAFAWEPNHGTKFAMIHAANPSSTKVNVTFYDMQKEVKATTNNSKKNKKSSSSNETTLVKEVHKVVSLEGKQCNCLFWSPSGSNIILASLGDSASGTLEFFHVDSQTLVMKEHYRANEVLWDPSGRTVATIVSQPISGGHFKFAMDNGYTLWTFQGKQVTNQSYEAFYQFQWRPRQSLLTEKEKTDVIANLKKYEREFDKADKKMAREKYLEETKGKRLLRQAYRDRLAYLRSIRTAQKEERLQLNNGYDSDDETNFTTKEYTIETILSTKEEVV